MDEQAHIEVILNAPQVVISYLVENPRIRELLANKKNATIDDLEDDLGEWKHLYDYDYIPGTQKEQVVAICIDCEIDAVRGSMIDLSLYISVMCSKDMMPIHGSILKGYVGNRAHNLCVEIDRMLRGTRDIGIGRMELDQILTVSSGNAEVCKKQILYRIPDFKANRELLYEVNRHDFN